MRGYYLNFWRYGSHTEDLVVEALERETWSTNQWQAWQDDCLAYVLDRAATQVPYYRQLWSRRRRQGDRASWENLENWPVLEKETLRQNPKAFVADDCDIHRMFHEHTSGTTGKSLDLWWSRKTTQNWYALFEARWRRWYGVSRHDRWAILGGQLVTPISQHNPPFWVWNQGLNQLYMSSYHLSPEKIPFYLDALKLYKVDYLFGYTSALHSIAQVTKPGETNSLNIKVAITNAEPLYAYQRSAIEDAFQCPVRETYGLAEIVTAASECEAGNLHTWPEVGVIEVNPVEKNKPGQNSGELVCTGLLNTDMPLIRYRVGDRVSKPTYPTPCSCKRRLPMLSSIEGRVEDVLFTRDGRPIGRLDPVFKTHLPIREAQIIQEDFDQIRVRYVPAIDYTSSDGRSVAERIRERMGDVKVILEPVNEIPKEPNGKFRAVVNIMPQELKDSLKS